MPSVTKAYSIMLTRHGFTLDPIMVTVFSEDNEKWIGERILCWPKPGQLKMEEFPKDAWRRVDT